MIKIFYDAEFTGLHRNSTFISIGIATETDSTFYAEFDDYDRSQVDDWIRDNVLSNLQYKIDNELPEPNSDPYTSWNMPLFVPGVTPKNKYSINIRGNTEYVRQELIRWLEAQAAFSEDGILEVITDCYAYDWMLLVDLITGGGTAINMPKYIHYIPIDLSTILWCAGIDPDINREDYAIRDNLDNILANLDLPPQSELAFKIDVNPPKHNSLFDAKVIKACFERVFNDNSLITPFN